MGGSAADTPATPEYLRASDAERDLAISALRQEFVEGRLSQDTFLFRVNEVLQALNPDERAALLTLLARALRGVEHDGAEGVHPALATATP